jgi:geranylgeranyl diphosphate synthase type I
VQFPAALGDVATRTEARIGQVLEAETRRWAAVDPELGAPLGALRDLVLAGGKRLRPAFCASAYLGAGGCLDDAVLTDACGALELLHTFALVHDDVMDGSDTRRGLDAVHRRFVIEHAAQAWRGESRRFGEGMAILVGDFAVVFADVLLRSAPATVAPLWDELRLELCVGQSLDLVGAARRSTDLGLATRIAQYKSAKYTVERPMHLGAALMGRRDLDASLSAIGLPLGEAFQLRDDVLGVFGDPAQTGKPVGDDLREGKSTPLLALAAARVGGAAALRLRRVGAADLGADDIGDIQGLIVESGALAAVEERIGRLVDTALEAIAVAPLVAGADELLGDLARYVAWRDH